MTIRNELVSLRIIAKRLARAMRLPLHHALDLIATGCGKPNWPALMRAWDGGWRPSKEQLDALSEPEDAAAFTRRVFDVEESEGTIAGAPYEIEIGFDYAAVFVKGSWSVYMDHAPSEAAKIEKYVTPNPLDDDAFMAEVMKIANAAADRLREAICSDWPRRSTKPDAEGRAMHPLRSEISADWYCLHCDTRSTGAQMAANMWHCPECSATPIDMFASMWWKVPVGKESAS